MAGQADVLMIVHLRGALALGLGDRRELAPPAGRTWALLLDSEDPRYGGRGDTQFAADDSATPALEMTGPGALALSSVPLLLAITT